MHKRHPKAVANDISRLDYSPIQDDKANWMTFMQCWCRYTMHVKVGRIYNHQEQMNLVFANCRKEDEFYTLTVKEIAQLQQRFQEAQHA